MPDLRAAARDLLARLRAGGETLVLAESCTGGLAAAALVAEPGASAVLAGSFVTYQEASKAAWLAVPADLFERPGVVSGEVAAAMAAGALERTPHASVAAAVTGHLGPDAPADLDGAVWIAVTWQGGETVTRRAVLAIAPRGDRQADAAARLLRAVADALTG